MSLKSHFKSMVALVHRSVASLDPSGLLGMQDRRHCYILNILSCWPHGFIEDFLKVPI